MAGARMAGAARVLVVEDDPAICELIAEILREVRVRPICARDEHEAYLAIPSLPTIQALVVDIDLGSKVTGIDVARFARRVIPDLPVIYVSGKAPPEALEAQGAPAGAFVQKPFRADELLGKLFAGFHALHAAG